MTKFLVGLSLLASASGALAEDVYWVSSTAARPWSRVAAPNLTRKSPGASPTIQVDLRRTFQTIDGFGGCFNELGWQALGKVSAEDRREVVAALFGPQGCDFNLARIPIGASDFADGAYSLDDVPEDYALAHFSLDRDKQALLPYIREALAIRKDLKCWASPWSPPAWMKTNRNYSGGELRWEPKVLAAYAQYFARWIAGYRKLGVPIYAVTPQNEPNIASPYPTCLWSPEHLREFIGQYLGPTLKTQSPSVELWLGLNGDPSHDGENPNARLLTVLDDERTGSFLTGIAFQYDSRNQIALAHALYPKKKLMQSETMCYGGDNSWGEAQDLYRNMKRYFDGGANAYFMWNMVLDETGLSHWNWRQNAMVTVNRQTGKVTYNGEYHVMRHFSQFVRPGARRVLTTGIWGDVIAFQNPNGSTVVVAGNSANADYDVQVSVRGKQGVRYLKVALPANSVNTFVIPK